MSIFPDNILNDEIDVTNDIGELETFKEYAIDFENETLLTNELGENIIVEKDEAIKVWIWKAIHVKRDKFKIYSRNYGNDFEELLIGKQFTREFIESEMYRMLSECLLVNKYILSIENFNLDFNKDTLLTSIKVNTIYNKGVEVNV
ncbi:DUF2634 domain-containing protein [Clostridium botulinum C]|uniref:DUF2634 domain-containing protein n=1 Tax=Clostridium haemolyticum NCTC 9693 TaxID=1443114 RepID=A0ABR4TGT8_CLOHA|nr:MULTISPECIES: DUF2634 domain-containing protein [Clostridium]KEI18198.1 hypothetical protein Z960_03430 [Clostridium haemolyticum NCTC 9693]MCD3206765.1 DUF2634 domain-containing protein [Clostridium botulinum C]MCD3209579.1 DUF2634 domain-containing protein [Clostridium botulinum C]MCD3226565.1 DUF2634 domain-containing protein [Clostridium botulinum C]MCD3248999.1 DUF2634 domain-containing protein [Clostridium botulinum C]